MTEVAVGITTSLEEAIARARGDRGLGRVHHGRSRRHPLGAACRARGRAVRLDPVGCARRWERLYDHFDETVDLEHVRLLQSPFATRITYRVVR
jgi:hypothetical protein